MLTLEGVDMNLLIWNEHAPEEQHGAIRKAYPEGMQQAVADVFRGENHTITFGWQSQKDQGLSEEVLAKTDVLLYWAHCLHDQLSDAAAERVAAHVEAGMGAIFLHSAHWSKPFKKLSKGTGTLVWREDKKHERLFNVNPSHPIASGVPCEIFLPKDEMYGEPFGCGQPDEIIFIGWFPGGEIFRSGLTYYRGKGRVFYFQPGHETFPVYKNPGIMKILHNAAMWAAGKPEKSAPYPAADACKYVLPKEIGIRLLKRK